MSEIKDLHGDKNENLEEENDEFEIPVTIIDPVSKLGESDEETSEGEDTLEKIRDRWLRAEAEIENIRKRTTKRIDIARNRERQDILVSLLEVADSFERALENTNGDANSWHHGMIAIRQQLLTVLRRFGAEPMKTEGSVFDPNFHEAVAVVEDTDHREDEIVSVMQTGYIMNNGTLLRPAKVVVAKNSS